MCALFFVCLSQRARRKEELEQQRERQQQQELRSYDRLHTGEAMVTNREIASKYTSVEEAEDDFM